MLLSSIWKALDSGYKGSNELVEHLDGYSNYIKRDKQPPYPTFARQKRTFH